MARTADTTFQPFIVRTLRRGNKTTEQLYEIARTRNLTLTRSRRRDASRPSQFAWQHQLRRDQFALANNGIIERNFDGTWGLTYYGQTVTV
jgi:hypothetical protein